MKIGVPREIKNHEFRVAIAPAGLRTHEGSVHSTEVAAAHGYTVNS